MVNMGDELTVLGKPDGLAYADECLRPQQMLDLGLKAPGLQPAASICMHITT